MKLRGRPFSVGSLIVGVAAASVIALTLLTRPLVGALWGLVLVCAGAVHAYRWLKSR